MTKARFCLFLLGCAFLSTLPAHAESDFLAEKTVQMQSVHSSDVLSRTVADPKAIFQRYEPALDSNSEIVRELRVTGPSNQPIVQVSIRKCIAIVCKTADLDARVIIREGRASCDRAFRLEADLSRSSDLVTNTYDRLDVTICYKALPNGKGSVHLSASAHQSPSYDNGFMQRQMFDLLQLQVAPIIKALQETFKAKENS